MYYSMLPHYILPLRSYVLCTSHEVVCDILQKFNYILQFEGDVQTLLRYVLYCSILLQSVCTTPTILCAVTVQAHISLNLSLIVIPNFSRHGTNSSGLEKIMYMTKAHN